MEPKQLRQDELLQFFEFTCECAACVNDFQMPKKLNRIDKTFKLPKFGKFLSNENILCELDESFKYMNDNIEQHPTFETAATILRTKELIRTICERISYPF